MAHIKLPVSIYIVDDDTSEETLYDSTVWYFPYMGNVVSPSRAETVAECLDTFRTNNNFDLPKMTQFVFYDDDFFGDVWSVTQYRAFLKMQFVNEFGCVPYDLTGLVGEHVKVYITDDDSGRYVEFVFADFTHYTHAYSSYTLYQSTFTTTKYRYGNADSAGSWISGTPFGQFYQTLNYYTSTGYTYVNHFTSTFPLYSSDDTVIPKIVSLQHIYDQSSLTDYYNMTIGTGTSTAETQLETYWGDSSTVSIYDGTNPYEDGGTDQTSNTAGNFSENSDSVEADDLPTLTAIGTGFATLFTPTATQLSSLAELFWSADVISLLQNMVENITDMFVSLAICPFDVESGSTVSVTWLGIDTAISLTLASSQFVEMDMGSIDMSSDSRIYTSGSCLDYSPFSRLSIYLPFIGTQELNIDECRGATIGLRYRIDILSGACVAIISVDGNDVYQFSGSVLTQIPITNQNMQSLISDVVNVGIATAGTYAGAVGMGSTGAVNATKGAITSAQAIPSMSPALASTTANAMLNMKPTFNKSGAISASASLLAVKQPYLILTTPRQSMPSNYNHYNGFPSNIRAKLGDLDGYTEVEQIVLENLPDYTVSEVEELERLLKEGVYI